MRLLKKLIPTLLIIAICTVFAGAVAPELTAETAVLIDAETGQVLYDKEMHKQMYPASITKVITIITGLEHLELSDTITMSHYAVFSLPKGSSHIALDEGEEITVEQAMHAALLRSANDACNGIAEASAGSIEEFTVMMNETAKRAGALNSNFINAHGISEEGHLTTAYDMAMICRHALKNEDFRRMFGTYKYIMPPNNKKNEGRTFINQHQLINGEYTYDGLEGVEIIGGKIGWTTPSKHTLITAAEKDGRTLIAVVLKCPKKGNQYSDTVSLFDYGFSEFDEVTLAGDYLAEKYGYTLEDEVSFLVESSIGEENIVFEFSEIDGKSTCHICYPDGREILSADCKKIPEPSKEASGMNPEESDEEDGISFFGVLLWIFLICIVGFGLFVLAIYIRKCLYNHKNHRRRH